MRELLLFFNIFFITAFTFAQITPVEYPNLVVNGDFEEYNFCPDGLEGILWGACVGWNSPIQTTPDYYHPCNCELPWSGNVVCVPNNLIGNQSAKSGNAYAGFHTWFIYNFGEGYKVWIEYIQGTLIDKLCSKKIYKVEFFLSLADSVAFATSRIGISFSESQRWLPTQSGSNFTPDLINNTGNHYADSNNWMLFSGYYLANGFEKYFIIGNFEKDEFNPDTLRIKNVGIYDFESGYYYIDDVSIRYTGLEIDVPNIFTPNGDGINDYINFAIYGVGILSNVKVYNRWGNLVFEGYNNNALWDGKYNNKECAEGTYYYIITLETKGGEKIEAKSSLFLLR